MFDKALSIVPGDIVSVARGRGWQRARVLKTLADNMLLLKFKDGSRSKVSAEHVLTEEESKNFRKAKGNTTIARQQPVNLDGEETEEDGDEDSVERSSTKKGLFQKLF